MTLPVFDLAAIKKAAASQLVLDTVRDALIAHADGRTIVPPPLHIDFPEADGDCHVKAGWIAGATDFTVKIATGFYRNPALGLPTNHGLVCVVSARTGQIRALLDDRGLLTAWRTAAAGSLITHAMARPGAATLAVFGTGEQARLQATWLAKLRPLGTVLVHGRNRHKAAALCNDQKAQGAGRQGRPARHRPRAPAGGRGRIPRPRQGRLLRATRPAPAARPITTSARAWNAFGRYKVTIQPLAPRNRPHGRRSRDRSRTSPKAGELITRTAS